MSHKSILALVALSGIFVTGFMAGYAGLPNVTPTYGLLVGSLSLPSLGLWLLLAKPLDAVKHTLITMASVMLWSITGLLLAHVQEFSGRDMLVTAFYAAFALFSALMEFGIIHEVCTRHTPVHVLWFRNHGALI